MKKIILFSIVLIVIVLAIVTLGTFFALQQPKMTTSASAIIDSSSLKITSISTPAIIKGTALNTGTVTINIYAPAPAKPNGMNWFGNESIPVVNGNWQFYISPEMLNGMSDFSPLTLQVGMTDLSEKINNLATGTLIVQNTETNGFINFQQVPTPDQFKSASVAAGENVKFVWGGCSTLDNDITITLKAVFDKNSTSQIITKNIKNTGEFIWTVPQDIVGVYSVTISSASCNSTLTKDTTIEIQHGR